MGKSHLREVVDANRELNPKRHVHNTRAVALQDSAKGVVGSREQGARTTTKFCTRMIPLTA